MKDNIERSILVILIHLMMQDDKDDNEGSILALKDDNERGNESILLHH